ncbi:MAG: hypothetical protein JRC86_01910 [Deltaproteobacteria bacterium]|nr:hypothetical protein [Deltaproteobacteria bacterium]
MGRYVRATIYIVRNGQVVAKIPRVKIFVYKKGEGIIVKDGRPVRFVNGKWVYEVM